jgi:hypothetical protein
MANVFVNLELVDSSLDAEDLQGLARNLLKQVRAVDGVEEADYENFWEIVLSANSIMPNFSVYCHNE